MSDYDDNTRKALVQLGELLGMVDGLIDEPFTVINQAPDSFTIQWERMAKNFDNTKRIRVINPGTDDAAMIREVMETTVRVDTKMVNTRAVPFK